MDTPGQQSGLGRWRGLEEKLGEVFGDNFWCGYTAYVNHRCDICTKPFTLSGAALDIQAAAVDGIQATKWAKCDTYRCEEPLASLKRNERCVYPNRILCLYLVLFLCESTTDRSFSRAAL